MSACQLPGGVFFASLLLTDLKSAPGATRTPNLLIRSQTLYPIELRARESSIIAGVSGEDQPIQSMLGHISRCDRTERAEIGETVESGDIEVSKGRDASPFAHAVAHPPHGVDNVVAQFLAQGADVDLDDV